MLEEVIKTDQAHWNLYSYHVRFSHFYAHSSLRNFSAFQLAPIASRYIPLLRYVNEPPLTMGLVQFEDGNVIYYPYVPSAGAGYAFMVLFGLVTLVHAVLMFKTRTWYFIPMILGGICKLHPKRRIGVDLIEIKARPLDITDEAGLGVSPIDLDLSCYNSCSSLSGLSSLQRPSMSP